MVLSVLTEQELCCSLVAVSSAALGPHIRGDEQCMPGAGSQKVHSGVLGSERVDVSHGLKGVSLPVYSPPQLRWVPCSLCPPKSWPTAAAIGQGDSRE